jgi:hypothetical protein
MLVNLALTCNSFKGIAYRRLYESFPVLDPEARVVRPLFDLAHRIENHAKFIPSCNAAFIRHLVWVWEPNGRRYSCFDDFLVKCVNVDKLTLYVIAKQYPDAYDLQLACKNFPFSVHNLSLRIVKPGTTLMIPSN